MAFLHTCRTCAVASQPCAARDSINAALRGLGVRSAKHRCTSFQSAYAPGDPVKVQVRAYMSSSDRFDPEERAAPLNWYRGRFIKFVGPKALAYVANGTMDEGGEDEPLETSTGFMKVPLSRLRPDVGEPISVKECVQCGSIPTLGQPCRRDPYWVRECRMPDAFAALTQPPAIPLEVD